MTFEKMDILEVRVRKLVDLVQELKSTNATLVQDLQLTRMQLLKQEEILEGQERERLEVRERIEKVLGDLDFLESPVNGA